MTEFQVRLRVRVLLRARMGDRFPSRALIAVLTMLVASTFGAATASAKPVVLRLTSPIEGDRVLQPGDYVEGESYGGATLETADGTINCPGGGGGGLYGSLASNNAKKDVWSVSSGKGGFEGGPCSGSFPIGGGVDQKWSGGEALGSVFISAKGTAQFKSSKTDHATLELASTETGAICRYSLKKLNGTAPGENEMSLDVQFHTQKVKLVAGSSSSCPKSAELSVGFGLKTAPAESSDAKEHHAFDYVEGTVS